MATLAFSEVVNFDKMVSLEATYNTNIDPEFMPRLKESCNAITSPIQANFKFYRDMQSLRTIEGDLKVKVSFVCQRCQKEFETELFAHFVSTCDEEKATSLKIADKLDIVDLNEDGSFNLLSFLEDCLLLEVPFSPTHVDGDENCSVKGKDWSFGEIKIDKSENPFASLASLKDKLATKN